MCICMYEWYVHMFMCVQRVQLCVHVYMKARQCSSDAIYLGSLTGLKLTNRLSRLAWKAQESICSCILRPPQPAVNNRLWSSTQVSSSMARAPLPKPSPRPLCCFCAAPSYCRIPRACPEPWPVDAVAKGTCKGSVYPLQMKIQQVKLDVKPIK